MAVDESRRLMLHDAVRSAVGADAALTLMEMLPPSGWGDVATRQQLDAVESRLDAKIDHVAEALRLEMHVLIADGQRRMMQWTVGTMIAMTGVFAAIVRL